MMDLWSTTRQTFSMQLSEAVYTQLVSSQRFAAVLFTATWAQRCVEPARRIFEAAAREFEGKAAFVELDVDESVEIANQIPVANVPTVAYYKDGKLVAALVGSTQDIAARLSAVMEGKRIGHRDGRVVGSTKNDSPKWWLSWNISAKSLVVFSVSSVPPWLIS